MSEYTEAREAAARAIALVRESLLLETDVKLVRNLFDIGFTAPEARDTKRVLLATLMTELALVLKLKEKS